MKKNKKTVKRICLLLDESKIMTWVRIGLDIIHQKNNVIVPLIIIRKKKEWNSELSWGKKIIQIIILLGVTLTKRQSELTKLISIKEVKLFDKSKIIYAQAMPSGRHGTKLPPWVIKQIQKEHIDLIIRRGFGILKGKILNCTPFGVLSYHNGNLRNYRGFYSTINAYCNNEKYIYLSVQKLNEKLDMGDLILEIPINIGTIPSYYEVCEKINQTLATSLPIVIKKLNVPGFKPKKVKFNPKRHYNIPNLFDLTILSAKYLYTEIKRKM